METRAVVQSRPGDHVVAVSTDGRRTALTVPARTAGAGSAVNGGEMLCLALATCYCNDVYREAAALGVRVDRVEVEVVAEFGGAGEAARRITYTARAEGDAAPAEIEALLRRADAVAEVHNTLRAGIAVERLPNG